MKPIQPVNDTSIKLVTLQQFSIERTTRYFLKGLRSNPFRKYLGLILSVKRYLQDTINHYGCGYCAYT
ncbi:MAG: hypothetical protein ACK5UZ_03360 [Pseudanabaena sp.]